MKPSVTIYKQEAAQFFNTDFEFETLDSNCLFTEGPVWSKDGYYLFSDTTANCVYKVAPGKEKEVFIDHAGTSDPGNEYLKPGQGGSNALAYMEDGGLLVCQHGNHQIARFNGVSLEPFISTYKGKPFNSPNDLVIHTDGRIYFSDPPYGLKDAQLNPDKFQPLGGVYQWKDNEITLVCDKYQYPNGVVLSRDETELFICSNKPFENFISVYDTGTNQFKQIFANETSDGIECDEDGNVYLCNKDGIIILDRTGERLVLIQLPSQPANICWGGSDLNELFVTARQNIFLIRNVRKANKMNSQ